MSKVIVITRVREIPMCIFNSPKPLPWVTLNVTTGQAESHIAFLAWFRTSCSLMATEILVNETGVIYYRDYYSGNWTSARNDKFTVVRPGWELHIIDGVMIGYDNDTWP